MRNAIPEVVVFAYDFPHRKTQDVLLRLFVEGVTVRAVLAAERVPLSIPPSSIRTKVRTGALVHPSQVARRIGAEYRVMPHSGREIERYLAELRPALGVIGGSRILPKRVIDSFSVGILNLHPGLIPEVRGLDALLWAVHGDHPLGVTAHLIDERVDAGRLLIRELVDVLPDDTVFDVSERLYATQLDLLGPALENATRGDAQDVTYEGYPYHRKMPPELEATTLAALPDYIARYAS